MARIRTIKPEMRTDEKLTECSLSARLLFIGMLNFADDNGNQAFSAKRIKMQVFPADAIDTQPLIGELLTQGVIIEYTVNEEKFLHIKGFSTHQVINRPSATRIPQPPFIVDSLSDVGGLSVGKEGKGRDKKEAKASMSPAKLPTCDVAAVIELYHAALPELPAVRLQTPNRTKAIKKLWAWVLTSKKSDKTARATNAAEALVWVKSYFERARDNEFLMGASGRTGEHANWQCDLDYLLTDKGMTRVIEKTKAAA